MHIARIASARKRNAEARILAQHGTMHGRFLAGVTLFQSLQIETPGTRGCKECLRIRMAPRLQRYAGASANCSTGCKPRR